MATEPDMTLPEGMTCLLRAMIELADARLAEMRGQGTVAAYTNAVEKVKQLEPMKRAEWDALPDAEKDAVLARLLGHAPKSALERIQQRLPYWTGRDWRLTGEMVDALLARPVWGALVALFHHLELSTELSIHHATALALLYAKGLVED